MLGTAKGPNQQTEIVVTIQQIIGMAHLIPSRAEIDTKYWDVNNQIDLESLNTIY